MSSGGDALPGTSGNLQWGRRDRQGLAKPGQHPAPGGRSSGPGARRSFPHPCRSIVRYPVHPHAHACPHTPPQTRSRTASPYPAPAAGKLAGLDKKLSRSLEEDVMEASSPLELSKSPVGPLTEATRCARASVGRCAHVCVGVCASAHAPARARLHPLPLYPSHCNSRKTLVYLILTLNHIFPCCDCSLLSQSRTPRSYPPTHTAARRWCTSS